MYLDFLFKYYSSYIIVIKKQNIFIRKDFLRIPSVFNELKWIDYLIVIFN